LFQTNQVYWYLHICSYCSAVTIRAAKFQVAVMKSRKWEGCVLNVEWTLRGEKLNTRKLPVHSISSQWSDMPGCVAEFGLSEYPTVTLCSTGGTLGLHGLTRFTSAFWVELKSQPCWRNVPERYDPDIATAQRQRVVHRMDTGFSFLIIIIPENI